jgi:hypothetical protein
MQAMSLKTLQEMSPAHRVILMQDPRGPVDTLSTIIREARESLVPNKRKQ